MDALDYLVHKYNLNTQVRMPVYVPDVGKPELASLFNEVGYKVGAEIGVQYGHFSELLCQTIPDLKLYAVDAWTIYPGYTDILGYTDQERFDRNYAQACARLVPYNCTVIRKWSVDAAADFADASLDFVYIDAAHDFLHCTQDIAYWSRKVRPGGIVSGHDYARHNHAHLVVHCKDVVRGWTSAYGIGPWFVLDKNSIWLWVVK